MAGPLFETSHSAAHPGEFTKTVVVNVIGDNVLELDEELFLSLSNTTNATQLKRVGVGTITNDD